jgi:hypothetical protein
MIAQIESASRDCNINRSRKELLKLYTDKLVQRSKVSYLTKVALSTTLKALISAHELKEVLLGLHEDIWSSGSWVVSAY